MSNYDNSYCGALFATSTDGVLSGPFEMPDGTKARIELTRDGYETGVHAIAVHRIRRNGSLGAMLMHGQVTKVNSTRGPAGAGFLAGSKDQSVRVVLWKMSNVADGTFYQVKPDRFATTTAFEL